MVAVKCTELASRLDSRHLRVNYSTRLCYLSIYVLRTEQSGAMRCERDRSETPH